MRIWLFQKKLKAARKNAISLPFPPPFPSMDNYVKPTLSSAISSVAKGSYFEFKANGDVVHKYYIYGFVVVNFWKAEDETYPTPCSMCQCVNWSTDANFAKLQCSERYCQDIFIPCQVCGNDCNGGDYAKWNICSRACL